MKKRTMALLLAGAMTTTVFTGCSKQSTADTTAAPKNFWKDSARRELRPRQRAKLRRRPRQKQKRQWH